MLAPHLSAFPPDMYPPPPGVLPYGSFPAGGLPGNTAAGLAQFPYGVAPQIYQQPYAVSLGAPLVAGGITAPPMPQGARSASTGTVPATSSFYPPAATNYAGPPPLQGPRVSGTTLTAPEMAAAMPLQPVRGQSWTAGGVSGGVANPSAVAAAGYPSGTTAGLPLAPSVMLPQVGGHIIIHTDQTYHYLKSHFYL